MCMRLCLLHVCETVPPHAPICLLLWGVGGRGPKLQTRCGYVFHFTFPGLLSLPASLYIFLSAAVFQLLNPATLTALCRETLGHSEQTIVDNTMAHRNIWILQPFFNLTVICLDVGAVYEEQDREILSSRGPIARQSRLSVAYTTSKGGFETFLPGENISLCIATLQRFQIAI